jgi:hypothetical protein
MLIFLQGKKITLEACFMLLISTAVPACDCFLKVAQASCL